MIRINEIILLFILTISMAACFPSKEVTIDNFHIYETPPNGIKIAENFFCDQSEMTNVGWREYMFWNKKIFGLNSTEYISTLPDTLVWIAVDSCLKPYAEYYLRHPIYMYHPVVGISQKQAEEYSKWRSDRVFEKILVEHATITYDSAQTKFSYFTIERYFNGELGNIDSDLKTNYYPEYRLPTQSERQVIMAYIDSVDKGYTEKCKTRSSNYCKEHHSTIRSDIIPCDKTAFVSDLTLTMGVYSNCSSKKGEPIYNLMGNVSEWTVDADISVGGGWKDSKERILTADTFHTPSPNAWTGFRNVFEWKRWEE